MISRCRGLHTRKIQLAAQAFTKHWHSHPLPMSCMQEACNPANTAASKFEESISAGLTADAALQVLEAQGLPLSTQTLGISLLVFSCATRSQMQA